jgi:hypothetical protein
VYRRGLYDLQSSQNIIRVIKSRRRRWAGLVACRGRGEICTGYWFAELMERDNLEGTEAEGRIITKWNFKKCNEGINLTERKKFVFYSCMEWKYTG